MNHPIGARLHVFELDDQTWFPQYLRERIQACLTFCWSFSFPNMRNGPSPSSVLARVLRKELGPTLSEYTFLDFCAGAGGPTAIVERHLNGELRKEGLETVQFVLTDLYPNPKAWKKIEKESVGGCVRWVKEPVDAGKAPGKDVLLGYGFRNDGHREKKKTFRMFNLAFHHFDDDGAKRILKDALSGSDAIGIFEIQSRSVAGFLQVFMIGPLLAFFGPFYAPFWTFGHMFFTYIIPILPFVMVFDGYMSALRTRTPDEIMQLLDSISEEEREGWEWNSGRRWFAKPIGQINYFIGVKKTE